VGRLPARPRHYCRDLGLFGLEEAVWRMTGLSAARFGLTGRGFLAPGAYADITIFDLATIADRATFVCRRPPPPASSTSSSMAVRCGPRGSPRDNAQAALCARQQMQAETN